MSEAVIVALITAGLTLIGVIYSARKQNEKIILELDKHSELNDARLEAKLEKHMAVNDEKIDNLRKEVEKHNSLVEKTYQLETTVARHDEQIKTLFNKAG